MAGIRKLYQGGNSKLEKKINKLLWVKSGLDIKSSKFSNIQITSIGEHKFQPTDDIVTSDDISAILCGEFHIL